MTKNRNERSGRFSALLKMRLFRISAGFSLLAIFAAIVLPLFRLFPGIYGQPVVPLHYNIHYGVDWTGMWWQIFTLPAMGIVFFLVNNGLAIFFLRRDAMLVNVVLIANIVLTAFLFLAMVFVVSLNIVYG
ncbi:MAG: hypothetical protein WCT28_03195 [Patescibacteria group bacterium]|jgi:hypothetical protein